ncbi:hypothetical protein DV736_g1532, partial [Chaetothyriales sp. CBS 134916]
MRRRSTFIVPDGTPFDADDLIVRRQRLSFAGVQAAREERITWALKELPEELGQMLLQAQELHIRWAAEHSYSGISPFLSRLPSGLHVFYTPLDSQSEEDLVCGGLRKCFSDSLKCQSPAKSFIQGPIDSSSALQYYSVLPSLSSLVAYIQRTACLRGDVTCLHTASLLNIADGLDIDYDGMSRTLTVTAFWSKPPAVLFDPIGEWTTYDVWNVDIQRTGANERIEVGILNPSAAKDAYELQLSGLLTLVGEDDHPKPTRFHFPSRHHRMARSQSRAQQFTVSVAQPQGLHPTMEIQFSGDKGLTAPENRPEGSECALHAYLTLPSTVFVDEYAFKSNDPLFGESHGIQTTRVITGETDLEAPDYVVDKWGSIVLLELRTDQSRVVNASKVTLPLHLRYLPPSANGTWSVDVPWPVVYWACTAKEGINFGVNPFDRVNVGYDALHGPRTVFYHLDAKPAVGDRVVQRMKVPVYSLGSIDPGFVEVGTLLAIAVGFVWVVVQLWPVVQAQVSSVLVGPKAEGVEKKKEKKRQ